MRSSTSRFGGPRSGRSVIVCETVVLAVSRWTRVWGVAFASLVLVVTTYRSSWGQLLWFDNLMVIHLGCLAFVPGGWRVLRAPATPRPSLVAGWPLGWCAIATVVTYVLAGVAKMRLGGVEWIGGDVLANHIAYSAARLELLGGSSSPLASVAVSQHWLLSAGATVTVLGELLAPLALLQRTWAIVWVIVMMVFHLVIGLTMFVVFPYPLIGLAFAPVLWCAPTRRSEAVAPMTGLLVRQG
jgi:hypothetical protein